MQHLSILDAFAASIATVGSSWLAGNIASISSLSVPGLLEGLADSTPQAVARQWYGIYHRSKKAVPPVAIAVALSYSYLYWNLGTSGRSWNGFLAAALLIMTFLPWQELLMSATNERLIWVADGTTKHVTKEGLREMLETWKGLNLARSLFPLAAALVAMWSLLA